MITCRHSAQVTHFLAYTSLQLYQRTYLQSFLIREIRRFLVVLIILGKLPAKIKQSLVRAHGKKEWTITELQVAMLNELYIFEMRSQTELHTNPPLTTPFQETYYTSHDKASVPIL